MFDIARSDIYMVKFYFKLNGESLPDVYMYLPYVNDAGIIYLGGSPFNVIPVLSDRVISIGVGNVFIRLLRGKVTFQRLPHQIYVDGCRETVQVTYGQIYNKNTRQSKFEVTTRANSTLVHYLFCKYGVKETFKKYANCDVIIGGKEISETEYPQSEYVICSSMQIKPKTAGRSAYYNPSFLKVVVKRNQFTQLVKQFIGGLFYVVDHFPERLIPEHIHHTSIWKILLGHILISGKVSEGILLDEMSVHITSLDEYIDGPIAIKLRDIGIDISDFYDLMAIVTDRFSDWVLEANDNINSMYDKELSVLYFVLYDITSQIFKLYFKLKAASVKQLNVKEVTNIFRIFLRTGLIFGLTKSLKYVSSTAYSGDNKALKFTSLLVPQSSLNSAKGRTSMDDPTKRLHVSVAEIGGYLNIPKSEPSGRSRLNLFTKLDNKSVVVRDPQFIELLDNIQQLIK